MNIERRTKDAGRNTQDAVRNVGSAIILAVVLTSLLAIIGVIFLLSSRVDSIATSAISENKDLNLAVDTVIAQISEDLAFDVFRGSIDPNQYCDYPDPCNPWLASLEPNDASLWPHITDLNFQFSGLAYNFSPGIVPNYQPGDQLGDSNGWAIPAVRFPADADGDGVSDSMWVKIPDKTSSKGKPIFAAIRIVDNSGMLNVNTGYKFDPCDPGFIDGSSQTQINLLALSAHDHTNPDLLGRLLTYRCGFADANLYEPDVVWQYGQLLGVFTPFDISDEIKLRNRYILNYKRMTSRIEKLWTNAFDIGPDVPRYTPYNNINDPNDWFWIAYNSYPAPCPDPCTYDYRHIATTYNLDRTIDPTGQKMFNINSAYSANKYEARDRIEQAVLAAGLDPVIYDPNQIAVNLIDYIDADDDVTVIDVNKMGMPVYYFGFETPCIYISEIAQRFIHFDANTPDAKSYAIELYKPYWEDRFPSTDPNYTWQLLIVDTNTAIPIVWSGTPRFHVIEWVDYNAPIEANWSDVNGPNDVNEPNNPRTVQYAYFSFSGGEFIQLQRRIPATGQFLPVDWVWVPEPNDSVGWLRPYDVNDINEKIHSYQRDIGGLSTNPNKLVRGRPIDIGAGLWSLDFGDIPLPSIGGPNPWVSPEEAPNPPYTNPYFIIQAHPENRPFTNVGEIGMLFRKEAYRDINVADTEFTTRLNLVDPALQRIFNYLTVIDPFDHIPDSNETRIKGRININTAPWFVIAQLPWVEFPDPCVPFADRVKLAQAIVANRDTIGPFQNIGQLNRVVDINVPGASIDYYARDGSDLLTFPDLTYNDLAIDDFEERDVIFDRISNLITVRSDVFTAYILVRVGVDGPQKRVVAILDRSGVTPAGGKVKVVAIQSVPDPR
jgi:hypothetical protein